MYYRKWVSGWVQQIEQADNKGDTKTIYQGVKTLGGQVKRITVSPTMKTKKKELQELIDGKNSQDLVSKKKDKAPELEKINSPEVLGEV